MIKPGTFVLAALVLTPVVGAQSVTYDTISNYTPPQFVLYTSAFVQAEDTTLDPSAGNVLNRVELFPRSTLNYSGLMLLRVYTSVPVPGTPFHVPGQLLGAASLPVALNTGQAAVV